MVYQVKNTKIFSTNKMNPKKVQKYIHLFLALESSEYTALRDYQAG